MGYDDSYCASYVRPTRYHHMQPDESMNGIFIVIQIQLIWPSLISMPSGTPLREVATEQLQKSSCWLHEFMLLGSVRKLKV